MREEFSTAERSPEGRFTNLAEGGGIGRVVNFPGRESYIVGYIIEPREDCIELALDAQQGPGQIGRGFPRWENLIATHRTRIDYPRTRKPDRRRCHCCGRGDVHQVRDSVVSLA